MLGAPTWKRRGKNGGSSIKHHKTVLIGSVDGIFAYIWLISMMNI